MKIACHFVVLGCLALSASQLFAADSDTVRELHQLQDDYVKAVAAATEPLSRRYQAALEQLLKRATQANDTDSMTKIREQLGAFQSASASPTAKPQHTRESLQKLLMSSEWTWSAKSDLDRTNSTHVTFTRDQFVMSGKPFCPYRIIDSFTVELDKKILKFANDYKSFEVTELERWDAAVWTSDLLRLGGRDMGTLLLTRSETEVLLEPDTLLADLRAAFRGYSLDRGVRAQRVRSGLPGPGTATVLFPGTAADIPAYTVKVHAKFPEEKPAIRGVLCLHDGQTGALLAVMDSTHLTAVRTGLCSALATDVLARRDARSVAVIGAGVQGEQQLRALHRLRGLGIVRVYDTAPERALAFAERMRAALGLTIEVSESVAAAVGAADMVLAATWARTPFILPGMLQPGTHVSTIGPDEPGKCEVSAEVIREAVFVCDDRELAVSMGAIGGAKLGAEAISAELGEVIGGVHPGRVNAEQITVYGGVGLAFQDAVAAWQIYRAALARGVGREIDFLA